MASAGLSKGKITFQEIRNAGFRDETAPKVTIADALRQLRASGRKHIRPLAAWPYGFVGPGIRQTVSVG